MTIIDAINDTARALTNLSKVLVEVANETEGLPATEVMGVDATDKESEKDKKTVKKAVKEDVTLEMVRGVLAEKSQAGLTDKVKTLLEKFGANKLSAVKPEDYANLMAAAKELK